MDQMEGMVPSASGSARPPGRAGTALHGQCMGQDPLLVITALGARRLQSSALMGCEEGRLATGRWKASQPNGLSNLSRNYPGLRVSVRVSLLLTTSSQDGAGCGEHQQAAEVPKGLPWGSE